MKKKLLIVLCVLLSTGLIIGFLSISVKSNNSSEGTKGLIYELNSEQTSYSVVGVDLKNVSDIVIPSEYKNKPVVSIGKKAFSGLKITSIKIPDSVTYIGDSAFFYCEDLKQVELGSGVTTLDTWAFAGCSSLTSIIVPASVKSIGSGVFHGCSNLSSLTIPFVGEGCDYEYHNQYFGYIFYMPDSIQIDRIDYGQVPQSLKNVIITSATSIEAFAFTDCAYIEKIELPTTLSSVGVGAFSDCENLKSLKISEENPYYKFQDGAIYSKDGQTLVQKVICDNTLHSIPEKVKYIEEYAFYNCSDLTEIVIPESITSVGKNAFEGCDLKKINYKGTVDQWAQISFENEYSNPISVPGSDIYINNELLIDMELTCETIKKYAFYNCDSIINVQLKDGVKAVEESAFSSCSYLEELVIPNSVTYIGFGALSECNALKSLSVPFVGAFKDGKLNFYYGAIFGDTEYKTMGSAINTVPKTLKSYTVTASTIIGKEAFYSAKFTSLTISNSIKNIDADAFIGCTSLLSVNYNGTVDQWVEIEFVNEYSNPLYYAKQLKINGQAINEINLTQAKKVSEYAFYNCINLTSVNMGNSVVFIERDAFYDCSNLTSVKIGDSIANVGENAFYGCVSLQYNEKDDLRYLGNNSNPYAYLCGPISRMINTAKISMGCKVIGPNAFEDCRLVSVSLINGIRTISDSAFDSCGSLTSVSIPDSVTYIGDEAFAFCSKLTSVSIPDSVTYIGDSVFYSCNSLQYNEKNNLNYLGNKNNPYLYLIKAISKNITSVNIDDKCRFINNYAFSKCTLLSSVIIPNSVMSIGDHAFEGCSRLTSVKIPNSVTRLGSSIFYDCSSLIFAEIGDANVSVSSNMFNNCSSLTTVVIGGSVTRIYSYAFSDCDSLTTVYYKGNQTDWESMTIDYDNYDLTSSTILYYSETKPTSTGNYWHYVDGTPTKW